MNRRNVLKRVGSVGLMGVGGLIMKACKKDSVTGGEDPLLGEGSCILIPRETAGPFPLNLSNNPEYFRRDIAEDTSGVPLNLTLKVVNANAGCTPIVNARVDVWHCDTRGVYSGFSNQPGGVNASGQTFCRGIQLSDENGNATFATVYPGWYLGRATHIHFQVFLNNGLAATSQLAFPEEINTAVFNTTEYSARGQNPMKNTDDGLFRSPANAFQYQLTNVIANAATGGYDAALQVGIAV